jgi:hypothetical protein
MVSLTASATDSGVEEGWTEGMISAVYAGSPAAWPRGTSHVQTRGDWACPPAAHAPATALANTRVRESARIPRA